MTQTDPIRCTACNTDKPRSEFYPDIKKKDAVKQPCIECKTKESRITATHRSRWGKPPQ